MKTIYRVLVLGILMMAFTAVTVTPLFAQDAQAEKAAQDEKVALYKKYTDNFDKPEIEKKKIAIEAGKQYIEKYGANKDDADQVNYLKTAVPQLEDSVKKIEIQRVKDERYKRFDTALTNKNAADTFTAGKDVIANEPADSSIALDASIVLASVGFDQAVAKVDTYNNDAISNAKTAIQKLESGQTSKKFGYQYEYKTKENALGWMNYTIGYIMFYRQDKAKDALPYLYKATQLNSDPKGFSDIYRIFGLSYLEEALRIDKDRLAKIAAAGNKDTDETLALLALQKGYADRSIDGYARAYSLATKNPKTTKQYKDDLYSKLQDLYKFRYDGKVIGIDEYVSTVMSKPLPDPSTPVTPVAAEVPATATTEPATGTTAPTTNGTTKPATTPAKPATNGTAKPGATPTKPVSSTTTKPDESTDQATTATPSKTKTPVKKATPKKKPTR